MIRLALAALLLALAPAPARPASAPQYLVPVMSYGGAWPRGAAVPYPYRHAAVLCNHLSALHAQWWYDWSTVAVAAFESYLSQRAAQYPGVPLWLTEYGCQADEAGFADAALPIADRYAARHSLWALYTEEYPPWEGLADGAYLSHLGGIFAGGPP